MASVGAPAQNNNAGKNKPFHEAIQRALKAGDGKKLRTIADKLVTLAESGEAWAVAMVADRLDGKAVQQIQAEVDGTLTVEIVKFSDSK